MYDGARLRFSPSPPAPLPEAGRGEHVDLDLIHFRRERVNQASRPNLVIRRASKVQMRQRAQHVAIDARNDLATHGTPQPAAMRATLTRLVTLYVAWGKRDRAESYRALLGS